MTCSLFSTHFGPDLYYTLLTRPISSQKSRIRETPTLSTDANRRTDTNLKRLRDLSKKKKKEKKRRKKKEKKRKITQPLQICIGPSIRIGRESWCLPYAGFFFNWFILCLHPVFAELILLNKFRS